MLNKKVMEWGILLKSHKSVCSVFAPSWLDASLVMYLDTTGCGGPGDSIITPGGDGEAKWWRHIQLPTNSCFSKMFLYCTSRCQNTRMWKPVRGWNHTHKRLVSLPSMCWSHSLAAWQMTQCLISLGKPNWYDPWTGWSNFQQLLQNPVLSAIVYVVFAHPTLTYSRQLL